MAIYVNIHLLGSSTAKKSSLQVETVPVSGRFHHTSFTSFSSSKRFVTATILFILSLNFERTFYDWKALLLHCDSMDTNKNQSARETSTKTEEMKHQLQENLKGTTEQLEEMVGEAQDQAKSYTYDVGEKTEEMKEKVLDTAKSAMSQAQEATGSATGQAGQVKDRLIESTEGLLEKAKELKDKVLDMAESGEGRK